MSDTPATCAMREHHHLMETCACGYEYTYPEETEQGEYYEGPYADPEGT